MKLITCEKLEKSMCKLQFVIEAADLAAEASAVFKKDAKKYSIPGFRKGKAPRGMIEKMYGKDIFTMDAANNLFPTNFEAACNEAGIEPVAYPDVELVSLDLENGAVLTATVAVKPEVKVSGYTGLKVEKTVKTVSDEDVAAELANMQKRNARTITRDGAAVMGDTVDIDFEGFVDGVAFEGGKAEHFSLKLGSGQFIPGFEDQCVGHAAGEEFDVNVQFPTEYQAEELAGKDAVFKIKLHEVKGEELPELDDEFAKDVSEFDTLEELKASIRAKQQEQNDKQADLDVENKLVDLVVAAMEAEIPEAMFTAQKENMVRDFEYRLQQQGLNLDTYLQYTGQTREALMNEYTEPAEKQVKIRLAMEAVAAAEKIEASEEDVAAEIQRIADQYKMEAEQVRSLVNVDDLKKDLTINKAIDFIRQSAEVTEAKAE